MNKHTPTPWDFAVADSAAYPACNILANDGEDIILKTIDATEEDQANAEHAVKCVNHHDELVAALDAVTLHADQMRQYYSSDVANDVSSDAYWAIENAFDLLAKLKGQTETKPRKTMKYNVTVRRKEHREHIFCVEAGSEEEAEDNALEASCDHDFNQNTVHYANEDVTCITLVDKPKRFNHMLDVAFTVVSEHENWEDIPAADKLKALEQRLQNLRTSPELAGEAFGYSDTYEEEAKG